MPERRIARHFATTQDQSTSADRPSHAAAANRASEIGVSGQLSGARAGAQTAVSNTNCLPQSRGPSVLRVAFVYKKPRRLAKRLQHGVSKGGAPDVG